MAASKPTLYPLYAAEDEARISPVLDDLKQKGFSIGKPGKEPKKEDAILFFLSKNITEETPAVDTFLKYEAKQPSVIPVSLDSTKPPRVIESALLARNTVLAERYSAEELAERIADALKKPSNAAKKTRTWLIAAAAALLLIGGGILFWRGQQKPVTEITAETTVSPSPTPSPSPAPAPTEAPALPGGIPPEDVERIMEIVFVGDTFRWYTNADPNYSIGSATFNRGYDEIAYRAWEGDSAHWYSTEDGHEFPLTRYDDLSWLTQLTNLRHITFCAVDAEIPNLSGLRKLTSVRYCDNQIGSLEWLRGSSVRFFHEYHGSDVTDFSPLSNCGSLTDVTLDLVHSREADFSGFCPPSLRNFWIQNGSDLASLDLSRLGECRNLSELSVDDAPFRGDCELGSCRSLRYARFMNTKVTDFACLAGCTGLEELDIRNANLGTLDGIEQIPNLVHLRLESVQLSDISAIAGCLMLEEFDLTGYTWNENLTDLSALTALPRLGVISTHTSNISNLGFLNDLQIKDGLSLSFSAHMTDYSGLAAIRSFRDAHFNVNGRDFDALIMPYIQNARFRSLDLYNCSNVDLARLPEVKETLTITQGDLVNLNGLNQPSTRLQLVNCQYLTSLEGLSGFSGFGGDKGDLRVEGCPRLTDWSALNGMRLNRIELDGTYSIPDFSKTSARYIRFNHVDEEALPDLGCLDGLDRVYSYDFDFGGQENLSDLIPLFNLHGGHLVVPPHLGEQAEELVHDTRFKSYEIRYPDGSWNPDNSGVTLLSLEELDALPKSVLHHVTDLCMAGDVIYDPNQYWIGEDWSENPPALYLCRNGSEERVPVETGTQLTDLSILKNLTGLKRLELYRQPMETLSGIQYLESLESLRLMECASLSDASAAFTLQTLDSLNLNFLPVTDINGLQNLYRLRWLDLEGLDIRDLKPLEALGEDTEVNFRLPLMTLEEFLALPAGVLNRLERIEIAGDFVFDPWQNLWIEEDWSYHPMKLFLHDNTTDSRVPLEEGTLTDLSALPEMRRLSMLRIYSQPLTSLTGLEKYPQLASIEVRYCDGITDISPLYGLENLNEIRVSRTNVSSIEGVQNLRRLTGLDLDTTLVHDLSPLADIDYSYAETPDDGGRTPHFSLQLGNLNDQLSAEQYGYLSAVPYYNVLEINDTDWHLWLDAVKGSKILTLYASSCELTSDALRELVQAHPELERIHIPWNQKITDLTPLFSLRNLSEVKVSRNMSSAISSLGSGFGFSLEIEN